MEPCEVSKRCGDENCFPSLDTANRIAVVAPLLRYTSLRTLALHETVRRVWGDEPRNIAFTNRTLCNSSGGGSPRLVNVPDTDDKTLTPTDS